MLNNTASALIYVNPSIISKHGAEAIQGAECRVSATPMERSRARFGPVGSSSRTCQICGLQLPDVKYGMAISRKTIQRIKAVADDQRGDPAIRAVAQRKLEELQTIPRGFYNDIANWTKTAQKYKQTKTPKRETRDSYHLNFYMFQIKIYDTNEVAKIGPSDRSDPTPNYFWTIFDPHGKPLQGVPKYANGTDWSNAKRAGLAGQDLFESLTNNLRTPQTVEDVLNEIEHCMTVEGLEERLKKKARYWKDYEIRNAQWKMKAARKKRAEAEAKIKSAEAEIKQAEQDFRFGEELLAWASALEVPGL